MRTSRINRFITLALAALQFAVPAVVSVVDGAQAESGLSSATHIEGYGQNRCKPPHSADCAICRFLSTTQSQATATAAPLLIHRIATLPTATVALVGAASRYGFDSRAPPSLV